MSASPTLKVRKLVFTKEPIAGVVDHMHNLLRSEKISSKLSGFNVPLDNQSLLLPANSSGCPHDDLKYPATITYGFFETGHYQKNIS